DKTLARGFVRHFLTYATGAVPRFSDESILADIAARSTSGKGGVRTLVTAALTSDIFLTK
ncbi:MAG: DUF1585 domain-containing protein, partial [Verrucomicrobiae bacterium]|nr:DUF1585 domain-containing protein [Verrucomicrobiae bacterium]